MTGFEDCRDRYEPAMTFIRSAQNKGNLYECNLCGKRVWSAFGNARRHLAGAGCPERDDGAEGEA